LLDDALRIVSGDERVDLARLQHGAQLLALGNVVDIDVGRCFGTKSIGFIGQSRPPIIQWQVSGLKPNWSMSMPLAMIPASWL
jgi:hypothetical protein